MSKEMKMSRRNFIKDVAVAGAAVATTGTLSNRALPAFAASIPDRWDKEADVVCVGYGGAGAITGITAADFGASVMILEKQPNDTATEVRHTPNTRSAGGVIVCPTDAAKAADHLYALSWGTTPRDICEAWGKYTVQNVQWIEKMGGLSCPEINTLA